MKAKKGLKSGQKIIRCFLYSQYEFDDLVRQISLPLIFVQKKLFSRVKYKIRGLVKQIPIYLFMESAVYSSIEFIHKHFKNGSYTLLEEKGYMTLIIFRGSYVLIQYVIPNAVNEFDEILVNQANIKWIDFDKTELDQSLLLSISREGIIALADSNKLYESLMNK